MRQTIMILAFFFDFSLQSCTGQQKVKEIPVTDLTFTSIFGENRNDSLDTYCLLGTGFFRTPRSGDTDSLIQIWLTQHKQAKVVSVATHGPTMSDYHDSKMTYCWIIDGRDTINTYLIKNGCFPGGTMMRPETYDEMSKEMKEIYKDIPKPNIIIHIDKKAYEHFIEQIKVAETFAKQNKLGIWKEKSEDE